jgi:hypothetical protein
MYAKITKDHLWEDTYPLDAFNRTGKEFGEKDLDEELVEVQLFDDDGILYYEAESTNDDMLELLFEWAQLDAGVTLLKINENGKWVDCIG